MKRTLQRIRSYRAILTVCGVEEGGEVCILPSGEEVNFYQVIPLYQNEMEYKMEHDADSSA